MIVTLSSSGLMALYGVYCRSYRWVEVGEVTQLYLYPLKSGQALSVPEVECGLLAPGLGDLQDRGFMVVTSQGRGVDLRSGHDRLVLIQLEHLGQASWRLSAPGVEPCTFTAPQDSGEEEVEEVTFSHLDTTVSGADCGEAPASWVSNFLGAELRIIQHKRSDQSTRKARPKYTRTYPRTFLTNCVPSYADVTPYMVTSDKSLLDLNSRLPEHIAREVTQVTFRPNMVVGGSDLAAWEEDRWVGEVRLGGAVLTYSKDCTRCTATKINPVTGELYPENQPLAALKEFRQHEGGHRIIRRAVGDSPIFGMHYTLLTPGYNTRAPGWGESFKAQYLQERFVSETPSG